MSDLAVGHFDAVGFLTAVNQVRQERNVSWRRFYRQTGVQASNIKIVLRKKHAGIHTNTLAALVLWSGINPQTYMELRKVEA
ncbi:hypothetical protein [Ktedonobacter racemifer]|uniref:Uncharacterized protein n=1 Tax=Ktedonobacter racemifer DSM 44963 TaxID=485913 RepID=D6U269_KTERA|nr:hypothetical protein [Ktedonobacter racemifer]EFH82737.1 hypothetical protein Krac_3580 [Ktedonobacter racemifer DSM 44963]